MPPHSEQIVSRICGALFRGSLATAAIGMAAMRSAGCAAYRQLSPHACAKAVGNAPTACRRTPDLRNENLI
ncbi:hypothetical protein EBA01_15830 [Xanthomonas oryzae pv. oryzae]|nr:hypothetical protein BVV16_16030 [Xanthomonas oryzae pv. oryzae]AUI94995.1 hypothetical protein BVV17_16040 [Xanthomonas oryzae pv. oryzae]AUI98669.1 hypothetical protein BVV18_16045 [Xanthomonas oryzae pv. oryzae]AUJ02347.1 hypothetical protein BVV10_16050 [Xanthomonas oryzae pv. oryzae]AUJ06014.1 hypothetical protein BVV19_16070 [Xanthomonas oryzae pv. oryzae]